MSSACLTVLDHMLHFFLRVCHSSPEIIESFRMLMCLVVGQMLRTIFTYFGIVTISGTFTDLYCLALNDSVCNLFSFARIWEP